MKVVFKEFKSFGKTLILLVFSSLVSALCLMAIPMCMQQIIDVAIPDADYGMIFRIAGKMILFLAIELGAGILSALCPADTTLFFRKGRSTLPRGSASFGSSPEPCLWMNPSSFHHPGQPEYPVHAGWRYP